MERWQAVRDSPDTSSHPLQPALDRSAQAFQTVTDLLEIATQRRKTGRPDARQPSLYRAIITASVGVVEESVEAIVVEALRATGLMPGAVGVLKNAVSKMMQNPNSQEIRKLSSSLLGHDPAADVTLRLRTSSPAFRNASTWGSAQSHEVWTIYDQDRTWTGAQAHEIWDRFVRVRHSFAHQDSSTIIFAKDQITTLKRAAEVARDLWTSADREAIERINATVATRVLTPCPGEGPVRDWRVHETQATNAFLAAIGVVSSVASSIADFLNGASVAARERYGVLHLDVESGAWTERVDDLFVSPSVIEWRLTKYAPRSRVT